MIWGRTSRERITSMDPRRASCSCWSPAGLRPHRPRRWISWWQSATLFNR